MRGDDMNWKRTLVINDFPPSTLAGGPLILRQCLLGLPSDHLFVLCCASFYNSQGDVVSATYLPCYHEMVSGFPVGMIRPRRYGVVIEMNLNALRVATITKRGIRICKQEKIEAIVTGTVNVEYSIAAARVAKACGIPLYIWEPDDWFVANHSPAVNLLRGERIASLHAAAHIWTVSKPMQALFYSRYGLESEPLHHVLDVEKVKELAASFHPPTDVICVIYTGSINDMFRDTLAWFAAILNEGLKIDGKQVELTIWTAHKPTKYLGPHVHWGGFVPVEQVPEKLGASHVAVVLVSFTSRPDVKAMVETSIYTKTVDYFAAGTPTLIVAPSYAAEIAAFGEGAEVLTELSIDGLVQALNSLILDKSKREAVREAAFKLVREHHSFAARERIFLSKFKK